MKHIILLQKAHDLLVTLSSPENAKSDNLAQEIKAYLNNQNTHAPGCWSWGPQHYMCAYHRVLDLQKELKAVND